MNNVSADQEIINFKKSLKMNKTQGLVLDIDETLSWTFGYWVEQMQIRFGNPENLSTSDIVKKYKYHRNVPYWQTNEILEWVEFAKTDNILQEKLPLIAESNIITKKINKLIQIVGYLTVRPRSVTNGSKNWLDKHNFPKADILARPTSMTTSQGNKWKAEVLQYLYPEVLGIVDDNPSVVDNLSQNYKGTVFLYNNETINNTRSNIIPCKTWSEVYKKVKLKYGYKQRGN